MSENKKYLIVIAGPTAIGKTKTAIALAKHFQSEIIAADSRQFYKEMNIGTAVPSLQEINTVPHHFVQHRSIFDAYNVGDFEKDTLLLLEEKFKKHTLLFMVGGSGLYIDAVVKGLDDFPNIEPQIKESLQKQFFDLGIKPLQQQLQQLDPNYFAKVDQNNAHRLIRALEVCIGTGQPYSSYLGKKQSPRNFNVIKIGLTADRNFLYDQINQRVDNMIQDGLIQEAKQLYEYRKLNALQTVGYKELFNYFDQLCTLDEAIAEIKKNTRRYAKRQLTWLRKDQSIKWFEYPFQAAAIITHITLEIFSKKEF